MSIQIRTYVRTTRSKVKVKVMSCSKLEIRLFLKATSSVIYSCSWQLTSHT